MSVARVETMHDPRTNDDETDGVASFWRRLLHRWFVEYNPLYLVSAMLVLGGTVLSSRGLAHEGSRYGEVFVAAIAEVYSVALIAGAALLMRVGHRRSAVMLALLTVLYQCDLTLHTETCPNLGWVGAFATGAWIAVFVAKLFALAWAMQVRLSRSAVGVAALGALGLALLPYVLPRLDPRGANALVALWMLALSAFDRSRTVESVVELDEWGRTVLRRGVRATWLIWALLLSLHVVFWTTQYRLAPAALLLIVPLLVAQRIRSESHAWCVVVSTLLFVAVALPSSFSVSALVAAAVLGLRAWTAARSLTTAPSSQAHAVAPYRAVPPMAVPSPSTGTVAISDGRAAMPRLVVGAAFALYLSLWTLGWTGGLWPAHIVSLDLLLTAVVLFGVWKVRAVVALAPLSATWIHFVVQAGLVSAPRSLLEWGASAIGLGFAVLIASLAVSYRLRPNRRARRAQG